MKLQGAVTMVKTTGSGFGEVIKHYVDITKGKLPKSKASEAMDLFLRHNGTLDPRAIAQELARAFPAVVSETLRTHRGEFVRPLYLYTVQAYMPGGGIFKVRPHILGRDVFSEKRAISNLADEGTRLRYEVIEEGAANRTVGMADKAYVVNAEVASLPAKRR